MLVLSFSADDSFFLETSHHDACTTTGVCGKTSETAACQDALTELLKSIGVWAVAARETGATEDELHQANVYTLRAAFSTLTNVNFSDERIAEYMRQGEGIRKNLQKLVKKKGDDSLLDDAEIRDPLQGLDFEQKTAIEIEEFGMQNSIPKLQERMGNDDAWSLHQAALYGLRGVCAYAAHCYQLGAMQDDISRDIHEIWAKLANLEADTNGLLALVLRVGQVNGKVLKLLDEAHVENFGVPEVTQVRKTAVAGPVILVSGHDLKDLHELLKQTEGRGINVYTHGEMLPAHSYPKLKEFDHLKGNFGTGW